MTEPSLIKRMEYSHSSHQKRYKILSLDLVQERDIHRAFSSYYTGYIEQIPSNQIKISGTFSILEFEWEKITLDLDDQHTFLDLDLGNRIIKDLYVADIAYSYKNEYKISFCAVQHASITKETYTNTKKLKTQLQDLIDNLEF